MIRLILRMTRSRLRSHLATAGVVAAATVLLTAFAGLADTALAIDPSGPFAADDRSALLIVAGVLGLWTAAIVIFALASAVSLGIGGRSPEVALLRSIAVSPGQLRRMVLAESTLVALPAIVAGLLPGLGLSWLLLNRLTAAGLLLTTHPLHLGSLTLIGGPGTGLLVVLVAGWVSARAVSRIPPARALAAANGGATRSGSHKARTVTAIACLVVGFTSGGSAVAMPDAVTQIATAGPACVFVAIGLALLAPAVVARAARWGCVPFGPLGRLVARNLSGRAGAVVGPLVLLVGISTGTLYMQAIHNARLAGRADSLDVKMAAVNYLIVAMIVLFAAVAVVTTLTSLTRGRGREFALLRITAATPRQVLRMVGGEALVTALVAVVLGTVAAAATLVPYSLARTGSPWPAGGPWIYLSAVGVAVLIAQLATVPTTVAAIRPRAVTVLAG